MQHKPIDFGNMEEGLDRQLLTQVQKRFLQVNRERLARAALALGPRENLLLDVLPLLFHVNHPSLPGFTHYDTPAGIHAYQPDAGVLRQIKTLSRAFQLQRGGPVTHAAIDALFLMGSPGTLGQSVHSDLDVWVCHRPGLASPELAKLRRKTDAISQWAAGEGIELHFFLMNAEAFKNGIQLELDNESSGSTQHRLLLDEFYRTALHLAGKLPLWWFVPAQQEHVYGEISHILLHRRFLRRDDVIDFGSTQPIPTAEFVSAATWQLYKAIDAPYKAILKLLLLEVYAEQLASGMTLAQQFKRAIYAGQLNVDELDPYLMLYRRLESYVQDKQQTERLDLLRRCFYFKVNQALSRRPPSAAGNWQRSSLQQLVATWGWTSNRLSQLDQRRQWKCLQVMREREVLIRELNGSYRYVHDLAGADDSRAQRQEMLVLGRKLYAAYETSLGKIEWINPAISADMSEAPLSIFPTSEQPDSPYSLCSGTLNPGTLLRHGNGAGELLIWAYRNGIGSGGDIHFVRADEPARQFSHLSGALQQWLPLPLPALAHTEFMQAASPRALLLLVNLESPDADDVLIETDNSDSDPFSYGRQRDCLLRDISIGLHNSWNEVFCFRHHRDTVAGLTLEFCRQQLLLAPAQDLRTVLYCRPSHYRQIILRRLENFLHQLTRFCRLAHQSGDTLFIFRLQQGYGCVSVRHQKPELRYCGDQDSLWAYLAGAHAQPATLLLDDSIDSEHPLRTMLPHLKADTLQVFLWRDPERVRLYIFDERNSLTVTEQLPIDSDFILKPLHRFLRNIFNRHSINSDPVIGFDLYTVEFYEVRGGGEPLCQQRRVANDLRGLSALNLQAFAEPGCAGVVYTVQCSERRFTIAGTGDYAAVASHILSLRRRRERYPCTITDLDISRIESSLPTRGGVQTCHYLQIKQQLEQQLNQAIASVPLPA